MILLGSHLEWHALRKFLCQSADEFCYPQISQIDRREMWCLAGQAWAVKKLVL